MVFHGLLDKMSGIAGHFYIDCVVSKTDVNPIFSPSQGILLNCICGTPYERGVTCSPKDDFLNLLQLLRSLLKNRF